MADYKTGGFREELTPKLVEHWGLKLWKDDNRLYVIPKTIEQLEEISEKLNGLEKKDHLGPEEKSFLENLLAIDPKALYLLKEEYVLRIKGSDRKYSAKDVRNLINGVKNRAVKLYKNLEVCPELMPPEEFEKLTYSYYLNNNPKGGEK